MRKWGVGDINNTMPSRGDFVLLGPYRYCVGVHKHWHFDENSRVNGEVNMREKWAK